MADDRKHRETAGQLAHFLEVAAQGPDAAFKQEAWESREQIIEALRETERHPTDTELKSLEDWLNAWPDGGHWADPSGLSVPMAKVTIRRLVRQIRAYQEASS